MFSTFVPSVQRFSHSYAVKFSTFFHQFKDVPTVLPRCSNIFHQFKDFPTVLPRCYNFCSCSNLSLQLSRDVFILFPSVQRFCHSYAVMLQLVLNSSRIVPNFCCDVATFFISFRIFLQLKWCCIFSISFHIFPQLKWCWNCFSSVPELSHTYAVMLQRFSSVQKKTSHSQSDIATLNQFSFSHC